jgi:hypothetical protein
MPSRTAIVISIDEGRQIEWVNSLQRARTFLAAIHQKVHQRQTGRTGLSCYSGYYLRLSSVQHMGSATSPDVIEAWQEAPMLSTNECLAGLSAVVLRLFSQTSEPFGMIQILGIHSDCLSLLFLRFAGVDTYDDAARSSPTTIVLIMTAFSEETVD